MMAGTSRRTNTLLVIRMSALGDVAMTVPVIYSFARQYPDWHIKVLTQPFFSRLFLDKPDNVSFIMADPKGRHKGPAGLFRLIRDTHKEHVTAVADMHNILRSWAVDISFILTGKKVRIVRKKRRERKRLTSLRHKRLVRQRNFIDRYFDVLSSLGLPASRQFSSLFPDSTPSENDVPHIGIAPFARYTTKTYPPEMMEKTAAMLAGKGYRVLLFGGKGNEAEELEKWESAHPGIKSVAGKLTIDKELELMSRLDLMVSMDSANMHLSSLAGTRVISVWGGTTVHCGFLGWRQKEEDAICAGLQCQPCSIAGKPECPLGHMNCLRSISPEEICNKITETIHQRNSSPLAQQPSGIR